MSERQDYGVLINPTNIKIHRSYFKQMVSLIGINCIYRSPRNDKHWTTYAEIDSNYNEPIVVGCIFDEHPNQRTMKKLGWNAELQTDASLISVPYDTPNIQVGALFVVPGGLDGSKGRMFRVTQLSNIMIYPASITCQIVPEYYDEFDKSLHDHSGNSFNLLNEEGDGNLFDTVPNRYY